MPTEFERTSCACARCAEHCKRQPGSLVFADLASIQAVLIEPLGQRFVASTGAIVGKVVEGVTVLTRIGSITPKRKPDGSCTFLRGDGRCAIHSVAPFGCRMFDAHMSGEEGDRREQYMVAEFFLPPYQAVRAMLPKDDGDPT